MASAETEQNATLAQRIATVKTRKGTSSTSTAPIRRISFLPKFPNKKEVRKKREHTEECVKEAEEAKAITTKTTTTNICSK